MKTVFTSATKYVVMVLLTASVVASCKKEEDAKLPSIDFKTGGNYTSTSGSATTSTIINVGIKADKNEADLKTFRIYQSIGSGGFSVKKTFSLNENEKDHYEKDYQFNPESKNNYETWKFEITDADANVNSVSFKITVN